jgi:hypothetical protein
MLYARRRHDPLFGADLVSQAFCPCRISVMSRNNSDNFYNLKLHTIRVERAQMVLIA